VDAWDQVALRRKQLAKDMGQMLQEMEVRQHPELKGITDRSPIYNIYKSYFSQWHSLQ
jgi:hypothetical protein